MEGYALGYPIQSIITCNSALVRVYSLRLTSWGHYSLTFAPFAPRSSVPTNSRHIQASTSTPSTTFIKYTSKFTAFLQTKQVFLLLPHLLSFQDVARDFHLLERPRVLNSGPCLLQHATYLSAYTFFSLTEVLICLSSLQFWGSIVHRPRPAARGFPLLEEEACRRWK
jgi:hypothetical protein